LRQEREETKLSAWRKVLVAKPTDSYIDKKIPAFYGTQMFTTLFTRVSRPIVPILSQINPIQFPYTPSWCVYGKSHFLDAFTKRQKEIVNFMMSD